MLDLCEADARTLEALLEAGLDCAKVPAEMRARAEKCAAVLALLGCGPRPECDSSLIDVTLVRVSEIRRSAMLDELEPLDEDALEALVVAGFDPERCASGLRTRAQQHAARLASLDVPIDGAQREALVSATLVRVQARIDSGESRFKLEPVRGGGGLRNFRWSDVISVAALLMLASAVIMPMVGMVRNHARQTACQAGLGSALQGFGKYANDYRESLPMASASRAGNSWWEFGTPERSNSANLFTAVKTKYIKPVELACPGNPTACRSVSEGKQDWSCSGVVVVADRSPVIVKALRGERINPTANSENHGGMGEQVAMSDGQVQWLKSPVLANGDNIWLPRSIEVIITRLQEPTRAEPLKGVETQADRSDVFLTP
jgi:hypothetical protein